jgi:2-haloacid dehalogenase
VGDTLTTVRFVLFDLNGTLTDPGELTGDLARALHLAHADGLTGSYRPLPEYLRAVLEARGAADVEERLAFARAMPAWPDAAEAIATLRAAGIDCGVLTNSSADGGRASLAAAGLDLPVVAGSDEAGAHKPAPAVYALGLERLGLPADEVCLVAAHWWDVLGAKRAGLRTGFVARGATLPSVVPEPDVRGAELRDVARALR